MKTDLFQSCGHCWVFQIFWHIECNTVIASSFRICNSSTGIPSPPLALFIVMFPKTHLTSHSRLSVSRWVIIPSWLSRSWRSFLYSSVYSCHLFLHLLLLLGPYRFYPLLCPRPLNLSSGITSSRAFPDNPTKYIHLGHSLYHHTICFSSWHLFF